MKLTTKYEVKVYASIPSLQIKVNPYLTNAHIVGYVEEGPRKKKRSIVQATCACGKNFLVKLGHYGKSRSCGCRLKRKGLVDYKYQEYVPYSDSLSRKFNDYLKRAKNRGIDFQMTLEEFKTVISQPCAYCSYPTSGLDRVDNALGYQLDNVKPCCKYCNRAKHEEPEESFMVWLNYVKHSLATK